MQKTSLFLLVLASLTLLGSPANAQKKSRVSKSAEDSVVITFKDGHKQSIPLADVDHIEFESATAEVSNSSSGHFLGRWKVGDGMGGTFYITLKRDGQAMKTYGRTYGTWVVVGEEARITWNDGWKDVIRRAGNHYEKVAYRPGTTFSDEPDNIADARSMEPI